MAFKNTISATSYGGLRRTVQDDSSQLEVLEYDSLRNAIGDLQNTNLRLTLGNSFTIKAKDTGGQYNVSVEGREEKIKVTRTSEEKYSTLVRLKNFFFRNIKRIVFQSPVEPAEKLRRTLEHVQRQNSIALMMISIIKDTTVTPKSVLSYLTDDGKQLEGDKEIINYLIAHPDDGAFSSENLQVDFYNKKLLFKKPLILSDVKQVTEMYFDVRPGSKGEFRGRTAKMLIEDINVRFCSIQDLCDQLSRDDERNYRKQQNADAIAGQLNSSNGLSLYERVKSACPGIDALVLYNAETKKFTSTFNEIKLQREIYETLDNLQDYLNEMDKPDSLLPISDPDHLRVLSRSVSGSLSDDDKTITGSTYSESKPSSSDSSGYVSESDTIHEHALARSWQEIDEILAETDNLLEVMTKSKNLLIPHN